MRRRVSAAVGVIGGGRPKKNLIPQRLLDSTGLCLLGSMQWNEMWRVLTDR